jgi:hypothetical protein
MKIRRLTVPGQPRQKVLEVLPKPVMAGCGGMSLSPVITASVNKRILVQASSDINVRPYLKNKAKRAGSMVRMVEHLPGKLEALSSYPSTAPK